MGVSPRRNEAVLRGGYYNDLWPAAAPTRNGNDSRPPAEGGERKPSSLRRADSGGGRLRAGRVTVQRFRQLVRVKGRISPVRPDSRSEYLRPRPRSLPCYGRAARCELHLIRGRQERPTVRHSLRSPNLGHWGMSNGRHQMRPRNTPTRYHSPSMAAQCLPRISGQFLRRQKQIKCRNGHGESALSQQLAQNRIRRRRCEPAPPTGLAALHETGVCNCKNGVRHDVRAPPVERFNQSRPASMKADSWVRAGPGQRNRTRLSSPQGVVSLLSARVDTSRTIRRIWQGRVCLRRQPRPSCVHPSMTARSVSRWTGTRDGDSHQVPERTPEQAWNILLAGPTIGLLSVTARSVMSQCELITGTCLTGPRGRALGTVGRLAFVGVTRPRFLKVQTLSRRSAPSAVRGSRTRRLPPALLRTRLGH